MNARSRNVVTALSLALGLALALGFWVQQDRARTLQRHDLWLAYVRGPLALYNEGSREGDRVLAPGLGRSGRRDLGDAIEDLRQAWEQAGTLRPGLEADEWLQPLSQSLTWLGSAQDLARAWPVLVSARPDQIPDARTAAEGLRSHLSLLLGQVWAGLQGPDAGVAWSPSEKAESAAALQVLAQPFTQPSPGRRYRRRRHRGHAR